MDVLLADKAAVSGGSRCNRTYADGFTLWAAGAPDWRRRLVCDATTSGGLLAADPADAAAAASGPVVGRLLDGPPGAITAC